MDTCHPGASVDAHPIDTATGVVDEGKLEGLLLEVKRLARTFSRRLVLPVDREDLEQDTVLACLASIRDGTWNGHAAKLSVIVGHIVRCQAVDRLRRRQCSFERDAEYARDVVETMHAWMSPEAAMHERELEAARWEMLESLSPRCRQAYELVREQGLSYAQAARLLGMTRSGVCAFVVKAQRKLRLQLKRRGIETTAWARREGGREAATGRS